MLTISVAGAGASALPALEAGCWQGMISGWRTCADLSALSRAELGGGPEGRGVPAHREVAHALQGGQGAPFAPQGTCGIGA